MKKYTQLFLVVGLLVTGILIGYTAALNHVNESIDSAVSSSDMQMDHAMEHGVSPLSQLSGDEFDKKFIEEMIIHHTGAVDMAQDVLKKSKRPELINLARNIIASQSEEVEMMKKWQQDWFSK